MALLAQCACFVTAPALAGTTVPNLFAPVVSGLACDLLYIAHQRLAMRRLFADADCEMPGGFKPRGGGDPKAQMKLLKKDLDRRRRVMASRLMASVDNSVAEGAKSSTFRCARWSRRCRRRRGTPGRTTPSRRCSTPFKSSRRPSSRRWTRTESVAKMRSVLVEIRDELANPKTAEEKEAERVAAANAELEKDPIDREPWRSLEKTLVEDQHLARGGQGQDERRDEEDRGGRRR